MVQSWENIWKSTAHWLIWTGFLPNEQTGLIKSYKRLPEIKSPGTLFSGSRVKYACILGSSFFNFATVVYFDQGLDAEHSIRWSKYSILTLLMLKS